MKEKIEKSISASVKVKQALLNDPDLLNEIGEIAKTCIEAFCQGNKVLFCGNGGSAADAQHLAAELSGRFYFDRPPLPSEALHVNTSYLTAVANDYGYDEVFSRMVKATGQEGDVLVGLSTSGNSPNVVKAFESAHEKKMITVGLTGEKAGKMDPLSDFLVKVPSADTPRIQECHILIGHILCEMIEAGLFEK
jgi:D-sedoheptulose 7-phosphate isomerase